MEKIYNINKKRIIIYLSMFLLFSGVVSYISIEDTMKCEKVLQKYDDNVEQAGFNTNSSIDSILKKMNYDRDHESYSFSLLRTIVISTIEILILYMYFLKSGKIVIDDDGIKVYSLYKKKANEIYIWNNIENIKFSYGEGIRGLVSEYGMTIKRMKNDKKYEEVFVPIERLLNYNEISDILMKKCSDINIEILEDIKKYPIKELVRESYFEYKNNFKSYMVYSCIIFIFAVLQIILKNSPANLIITIANIYFAYRAQITINYKAYMSYSGEQVEFDRGWDYAKYKIGRYFGANVIIWIIEILFIGAVYLCIISDLGKNYKILLSLILGIGCLFSISRIYLITYISSIADITASYMSLNSVVIKKYSKEVLLIVIFLSLQLISMIIVAWIYYKDLYTVNMLLTKLAYVNATLNLFIVPYVSCFVMKMIKALFVNNGGNANE